MAFLVSARATKIEVTNSLTDAGEISINTKHEFNVNYADDGEHCRAILHMGIQAQEKPELLTVLCTMEGDFVIPKINSDEDKKRTHIDCYYMVFPYAQALITRLCSDAGLPPFYMPEMEMKIENVFIKE